ncbi:MAG: hypothetical protein AAF840_13610, partial [Bacteroidota bacterium]
APDTISRPLSWSATVATTNLWRGVNFGESPSLITTLSYAPSRWSLGLTSTYNLSGQRAGFGNTLTTQIGYQLTDNIQLGINDYFFFSPLDDDNNFWRWLGDEGQHFIEASVTVQQQAFQFMAAYNFYGANLYSSENTAVYLEARYQWKGLALFAAYLTDGSALHFMDEGGFTNLGAEYIHVWSLPKVDLLLGAQLVYNNESDRITPLEGVGDQAFTPLLFFSISPN